MGHRNRPIGGRFMEDLEMNFIEYDLKEASVSLEVLKLAFIKACRNLETVEQIMYANCESYREECTKTMAAEEWMDWLITCARLDLEKKDDSY